MAHTGVEGCIVELDGELEALTEKEGTVEHADYTRRHMAISTAVRALRALLDDYEGGTMTERPADQAPEAPPPPPDEPPPAEEPAEDDPSKRPA